MPGTGEHPWGGNSADLCSKAQKSPAAEVAALRERRPSCNISSEIPPVSRKVLPVVPQVMDGGLPATEGAGDLCQAASSTRRGFPAPGPLCL